MLKNEFLYKSFVKKIGLKMESKNIFKKLSYKSKKKKRILFKASNYLYLCIEILKTGNNTAFL
jgi:hypothetical protein